MNSVARKTNIDALHERLLILNANHKYGIADLSADECLALANDLFQSLQESRLDTSRMLAAIPRSYSIPPFEGYDGWVLVTKDEIDAIWAAFNIEKKKLIE